MSHRSGLKVSIEPTVTLRGVDPYMVHKKYSNSEYFACKIHPETLKINSLRLYMSIGSNIEDEVYSDTDTNGINRVYLTTDNNMTKSGNNLSELPIIGVCDNGRCGKIITTAPVGLPISMTFDKKTGNLYYQTTGRYHSYECAYADLIRTSGPSLDKLDPLFADTESLLLEQFHMIYPNDKLRPAKDTKLLEPNGPLTKELWETDCHYYQRTSNIYLTPIKIQYPQFKIINNLKK